MQSDFEKPLSIYIYIMWWCSIGDVTCEELGSG